MIWSYRAVNNRVARKKWLALGFGLIVVGLIYTIFRIIYSSKLISSLAIFTIFALMVFLYTIITLGKVRYYFIEGNEIVYKPFRTKIEDVEGYEVDRDNMVIRLKLKRPKIFAVRTLYFDKEEEFEDVLRFLKRVLG
ncbi:hypothetical protein [Archaeoglobus profundus]|uniref:DUF5673 domain-containing protein n=1 Tax=Archaeoglobus profundus (strain DSM 5631 / JCM 9629 / NBRC 100127 / Av18) TaxID=572546 RepID=D2RFQ8_ARCPA|nr:hypothetical protein [Archaeoglobus profundus]ADB57133.1 hypothetical protein Arcpr_0057 [Archaeoglobus profundus DSM 5631]